jgi:hypothetical protein
MDPPEQAKTGWMISLPRNNLDVLATTVFPP